MLCKTELCVERKGCLEDGTGLEAILACGAERVEVHFESLLSLYLSDSL